MKYYYPSNKKLPGLQRLLILVLAATVSLSAQNINTQFRLAQSLERSQSFAEALVIYQRIYTSNPQNNKAITGIINCSKALQRYDDLIAFLQKLIAQKRKNYRFLVDLGEAYFLNGQAEEAFASWSEIINLEKTNVTVYRLVASVLIRQRLYDRAIDIYRQALQNVPGSFFLHLDIANLYRARLNLGQAAEHYLLYYRHNRKYASSLQRELLRLTGMDRDITAVLDQLNRFIAEHPNDLKVKEILAGIYINNKQFDKAFSFYLDLENNRKSGQYLYNFATEAFKNEAFEYAERAHTEIINSYQNSAYAVKAQYQLARVKKVEAFNLKSNDRIQQADRKISEAIRILTGLTQKQKIDYFSDYSHLMLGDIYFRYSFDLDRAIFHYSTILDEYQSSKIKTGAALKLADTYLIKGDLNKAEQINSGILNLAYNSNAAYRLGEIKFFRGQFSSARKKYQQIIDEGGSSDSLVNNALERIFLIDSHVSDSLSLSKFSRAEQLTFQQKYAQAIETFAELITDDNSLGIAAGKKAAILLLTLDKSDEAVDILSQIIEFFPGNDQYDEVLFLMAEAQKMAGNYRQALDLYLDILNNYQTSLHYEQSRSRARKLNALLKKEQI